MKVEQLLKVTFGRCRIYDFPKNPPLSEIYAYDPDYGCIADTNKPDTITSKVLQREVKTVSAGEDFDLKIEVIP